LLGENDRAWTATIDWFLRPDSVDKILEGQYLGKKRKLKPGESHVVHTKNTTRYFDGVERPLHYFLCTPDSPKAKLCTSDPPASTSVVGPDTSRSP